MTERVTGRRWMGSAVVTVLLALGLVVTTLAIALSVAERPDNIFSTGKIRLNLNDRKPVITENEGADCWYRLYFNNVSGSLSSVLEVTVSDGETVLFTGKMSDLTQSSADWLGILPAVGAAGSCRTLTITFHFPEDAGNAAQGGTLQFDLCADGTQVQNNPNKEFPVESPRGVTYETNLE